MAEPVDTLVVGASAAGLSTACCLAKAGVEHVILEKEAEVATAWRNHYERLHLHTTKSLSQLPYRKWGADIETYPARDAVVKYLEGYAERFDLFPRFGQEVRRIEQRDGMWLTQSTGGEYLSKNVVIATGYTRVPFIPSWPGQDDYGGELLHSSKYKNGDAWKGERVLVVGFGNSACEIAIDLHERGARPTLSVRGGVNIIPRDLFGIPILGVGISLSFLSPETADLMAWPLIRATIGDVRKLGLKKLPYGPNVQIQRHGRIPLLDIGTVALIKKGEIEVRPNIQRFTRTGVVFEGGREEAFAAVVLGTGYRPALSDFLAAADQICSPDGVPTKSGAETLPGLYFCGFYVSPTGMLREIALEARRIALAIAESTARARSLADG
ncbi:MAG: NAD(P)/FAD-dependent oxidoreductase [Myxococcales bacterium]|nr:NAD(P)/FAD-dependent oxidoreductase [Myxococcales bacterium]